MLWCALDRSTTVGRGSRSGFSCAGGASPPSSPWACRAQLAPMATTYENMVLQEVFKREHSSKVDWARQHANENTVYEMDSVKDYRCATSPTFRPPAPPRARPAFRIVPLAVCTRTRPLSRRRARLRAPRVAPAKHHSRGHLLTLPHRTRPSQAQGAEGQGRGPVRPAADSGVDGPPAAQGPPRTSPSPLPRPRPPTNHPCSRDLALLTSARRCASAGYAGGAEVRACGGAERC